MSHPRKDSFPIAVLFPQRNDPDTFRATCEELATNIKNAEDLRVAVKDILILINRSTSSVCDPLHGRQLFRIFAEAVTDVLGWGPLSDAFRDVLSNRTKVVSKFTIEELDRLNFNFSGLPNWCLNPYDKETFDLLCCYGRASLIAPCHVFLDDVIRPAWSVAKNLEKISDPQVEMMNLQGFVEMVQDSSIFVSEALVECSVEEFIEIARHPTVSRVNREFKRQLHQFYDGLYFGADLWGRTRDDLKGPISLIDRKMMD
jgi:hypothetical protein